MRVNVNVLIGFLLCVLILCVVGVMRRVDENQDAWHPNEIYTHLGGSSYTSSSVSSHSSDGVVVAMRGVSRPSRRYVAVPAFSYAPTQYSPIASTQYSIGGTPSNSVASPVYTTSSATMKSFGAGMAAGGGMSMSGGSVRNSQSPVANSQSLIAYSQLPIANSPSPIAHSQSSEEAQSLMAAAQYMSMSSSVHAVGASTAMGGTYTAIGGSVRGPRRLAPGGGGWDIWLSGLGAEDGYLYSDDAGNRYYDMELLKQAFLAAQQNGNFPGWTWEDFLNEYFNPSGKHFVPVGEPWMLLILALGYAAFRFVRSRRRSAVAARS